MFIFVIALPDDCKVVQYGKEISIVIAMVFRGQEPIQAHQLMEYCVEKYFLTGRDCWQSLLMDNVATTSENTQASSPLATLPETSKRIIVSRNHIAYEVQCCKLNANFSNDNHQIHL